MQPSREDLEKFSRLASSKEGQALLSLLRSNEKNWGQAQKMAQDGDYQGAAAALSGLLSDPKVLTLLSRLKEEL